MSEVAPPLAGGRYHLRRVLGVGGMAVVYLAEDRRLDVERAVKMLRPDLDSRARERFDTEARTMAKLHHPNVVMVHDVAEELGRAYLVMELIDGGSIADRLSLHGAMPQRMAAEVCMSTLRGLQAAHDAGVIHRDIKPHNIMVANDGTVKVTDFGIAQEANRGTTKTNTAIGTLAYMSPEQRADAKSVDGRTDVYAAGCMLYKMLTDLEPFDLYNQEYQDEIYETVPRVFRPIIQTATRYRAEDRYPSAGAMVAALEDILDELPLDPDEAPPLGAPMQTEELEVPAVFLASDTPAPAAAARAPEKPIFTWDIAVLTILAVFFLSGGAGAAFLTMMGGVVAISEQVGERSTVETPVVTGSEPTAVVSGPHPPAKTDPVLELPVPEPEPEPEPEPAPAPAPVPEPVVLEPAPAPVEPRPAKRTHRVRISTRPAGTVCVDGTRWCGTTPWTRELAPGTYAFDLTQSNDPSRHRQLPVTVNRDRSLCWDFEADGVCE